MPTRTFTIEQAGKKRFWDVTWDGGEVEITSGAWGTDGRARSQSFASAASRDTFIEAEVRKVLKKGFTETNTVAPITDAPDTGLGRKVAAWRSRFEALMSTVSLSDGSAITKPDGLDACPN